MVIFASSIYGATIHGAIYDEDYNLIQDVQLEINTSPKQNHISKNGGYFFNVDVGSFEIVAERYYQNELVYSTNQVVEIALFSEAIYLSIQESRSFAILWRDVQFSEVLGIFQLECPGKLNCESGRINGLLQPFVKVSPR